MFEKNTYLNGLGCECYKNELNSSLLVKREFDSLSNYHDKIFSKNIISTDDNNDDDDYETTNVLQFNFFNKMTSEEILNNSKKILDLSKKILDILLKLFIHELSPNEFNNFCPKIQYLIGFVCFKRLGGLRGQGKNDFLQNLNITEEFNKFNQLNPDHQTTKEEMLKKIIFSFIKSSYNENDDKILKELFGDFSSYFRFNNKKLNGSIHLFKNILKSKINNDFFIDIIFEIQKENNVLSDPNKGWRSQKKLKIFIRISKFLKYLFYLEKNSLNGLKKFVDETSMNNFFEIHKKEIKQKLKNLSKTFAEILINSNTVDDLPDQLRNNFEYLNKMKLPFSIHQVQQFVKVLKKDIKKWGKFKEKFENKQSKHYSSKNGVSF